MSVGVGWGMGQGHVTLGHGGGDPNGGSDDPSSPSSAPWSIQCWDSLDHVDHLILLPERALTMDSGWLQADLAEILAQSVMNGVSPFVSQPRSSSKGSGNSRRRSLDSWSLVSPTGHQSSLVALATRTSRKFCVVVCYGAEPRSALSGGFRQISPLFILLFAQRV